MLLNKLEYAILDKTDENLIYDNIPDTLDKKSILRSEKWFLDLSCHLTKMKSYSGSLKKESISISAINVTLIPPSSLPILYNAIITENGDTNDDKELRDLLLTIHRAENLAKFLMVRVVYTNTYECPECGQRYESKVSANIILYCPKCLNRNELSCEYGYGSVTPCYIYCGSELIGRITDPSAYYLCSEKFGLNLKLKKTYLEALYEADEIISHILRDNRSELK